MHGQTPAEGLEGVGVTLLDTGSSTRGDAYDTPLVPRERGNPPTPEVIRISPEAPAPHQEGRGLLGPWGPGPASDFPLVAQAGSCPEFWSSLISLWLWCGRKPSGRSGLTAA